MADRTIDGIDTALYRHLLSGWATLGRSLLGVLLLVTLVPLGLANMYTRATWAAFEDGVLWSDRPEGVVAAELAPHGAAASVGVQQGDVLLAVNGQPVDRSAEVSQLLDAAGAGIRLRYTLARQGASSAVEVALAPVPRGNTALYFVLASVGLFSLFIGVAVRLRRPGAPVSLHFLWLSAAFFGTFTFSFNGRLDRLDWVFYWADAVSMLLLPPLFLHFTLVFPDRPRRWMTGAISETVLPLIYLPAVVLGASRVVALVRAPDNAALYVDSIVAVLDRIEPLYLSLYLVGGFLVLLRAFGEVRSLTAKRQLRWIAWGTGLGVAPFALGYALPYAAGVRATLPMELSAIPLGLVPLAFASAIVRYRLRDVEVIIKRLLVWGAAVSAIAAIYAVLLRVAGVVFFEDAHRVNSVIAVLATLVVVLLSRPVKDGIQAAIDRAFYRDRYDYRRALVGFARDLSTELDLDRLSERLIARVTETLLVDRMVILMGDERTREFAPFRSEGVAAPPSLARSSRLAARLEAGQPVALDEPVTASTLGHAEIDAWLDREIYYFVPCLSKEGAIAVLALGRRRNGEPLTSEDTSLLAAVAGQVATAVENGRLYQELRVKAGEIDRLREFGDSILESLDVGLMVTDREDVIRRWNRAMEQLVGRPREEVLGRALADVFDTVFIEALQAGRQVAPDGAALSRVPLPVGDHEDSRLLVNATIVPLRGADGAFGVPNGTIVILEDVTEKVQMEEQLQLSEKMASIGLLAAGVAHEVNTPLTGISSYTQMLLEGADPADPKTTLLEKIERQTFRAARIVNGLLNLSRPAPGDDRVRIDLNEVVNDVLSLLEHQFKVGKIQVRRELANPGPQVAGIEYKLQQVFLNLFLNAHDAMPKGGWLSVVTRSDGGRAVVEVGDTGAGIQVGHMSRIYDPFFSTKAMGRGTGLGLSITYGIVREHDGTITCDSQVGLGTRFTLSLPLAPALAERASRAVN